MPRIAKCHPTIHSDTDLELNLILDTHKITSWCNIYKYSITNQVTTILHQTQSYIIFRILLVCSIFYAH